MLLPQDLFLAGAFFFFRIWSSSGSGVCLPLYGVKMRDVEVDAGILAEDGEAMDFCAGGEEGWVNVGAVLGVGGVE